VLALTLAFGASAAWGSADFFAGVACRRAPLLTVLLVSQTAGLVLFFPVIVAVADSPPAASYTLLAILAGFFYVLAIAALYRGLAGGIMGVVAPIAATDAVIPVLFGILAGERPHPLAMLGIGLAFAGVILASIPAAGDADSDSGPDRSRDSGRKSVLFGLIAAVCFGCFVVALDGASDGGALWAVAYSRVTSVMLLAGAALLIRPKGEVARSDAPMVLGVGALDVGGTALFALATTAGLLSIVGILGSLYPVFTIFLAAMLLRERPNGLQRMGAVGALLGAALIGAG
jgi:drug/metabolite transporter (DMT)-like permease